MVPEGFVKDALRLPWMVSSSGCGTGMVAEEDVATVWEPYERTEEVGPWVELIDSVRGAAGLAPRAYVTG